MAVELGCRVARMTVLLIYLPGILLTVVVNPFLGRLFVELMMDPEIVSVVVR